MKYFIGNWKMFGVPKSINILKKINDYYKKDVNRNKYKVIITPPYTLIENYSKYFKNNHLYPMAASIWSSPINEIAKYPFKEFVSFFSNHGLLRIFDRPKWRTVYGGSKEYVKKVLDNKNIRSFKNRNVRLERKKGHSFTWIVFNLGSYCGIVVIGYKVSKKQELLHP